MACTEKNRFAYTPFSENLGLLDFIPMSAYGYERKFWGPLIFVRFTPESRHRDGRRFTSACDPKRTSSKWRACRMRIRRDASGALGASHIAASFGVRDRICRKVKCSVFLDLSCGTHKRAQSRPGKSASHTYPFHSCGLQFLD